MLAACESGDLYIATGEQIGIIRPGMSDAGVDAARSLMKTVVLGISYGMEAFSLALRTGKSIVEAEEILARMRARFPRYEAFVQRTLDRAGLDLAVSTQFGWCMRCPPGINQRTIRNFPAQSSAAEVLHVTCILAERRGIEVVAPVHDALLAQGPAGDIEDVADALDRCMRDASAVVLRGYELPTDKQLILPGKRFYDKRGVGMWETVNRLLARREDRAA
jgi:DNA polymerase I-like protein with 3'-5' exonuclease and polymerase domains